VNRNGLELSWRGVAPKKNSSHASFPEITLTVFAPFDQAVMEILSTKLPQVARRTTPSSLATDPSHVTRAEMQVDDECIELKLKCKDFAYFAAGGKCLHKIVC
jgi:hypothetical protein